MSDRHYLARVLGMSMVPRVVTSLLTLVSFPIMTRAVGASEYGIIVYLSAVIGVVESFADFGVSSAAGKGIAEARARRPGGLAGEVVRWARLQIFVALAGAVPVFGLSYLYVRFAGSVKVQTALLIVMVASTWTSICVNFVRAAIRSCLDFRALMILDTIESIARSASWIMVARLMPTAMGVAIATFSTVVVVSMSGVVLLALAIRRPPEVPATDIPGDDAFSGLSTRAMMRDSVHFLGLRLSTRMTQAIPIVVIEKVAGAGVVGVIGAFTRISELASFPFAVVGNALSVRAQEIILRQRSAVVALWNTVLRFAVLAAMLAGGVAILARPIADVMLPGNPQAVPIFAMLATTILTTAIGAMIAPMSDYVGALPKRVAVITAMSIIQIPLLWAGAHFFRPTGAAAGYVVALCFTSAGFVYVAKRAFFGTSAYWPSRDVIGLLGIVVLSLGVSASLALFNVHFGLTPLILGAVQVACATLLFGVAVLATKTVRESLMPGTLFDFTR